jgi:hypothetical protein
MILNIDNVMSNRAIVKVWCQKASLLYKKKRQGTSFKEGGIPWSPTLQDVFICDETQS